MTMQFYNKNTLLIGYLLSLIYNAATTATNGTLYMIVHISYEVAVTNIPDAIRSV